MISAPPPPNVSGDLDGRQASAAAPWERGHPGRIIVGMDDKRTGCAGSRSDQETRASRSGTRASRSGTRASRSGIAAPSVQLLIAFCIIAATCTSSFAQGPYGVQVGAFSEESRAREVQSWIGSTTIGAAVKRDPAALRVPYKVLIGPISTYAEAMAWRAVVCPSLFKEAFVEPWGEDTQSAVLRPRSMPFDTAGLPLMSLRTEEPLGLGGKHLMESPTAAAVIARLADETSGSAALEGPVSSLRRDQLLAVGFRSAENSRGTEALKAFLQAHPTDALADAARLRYARRLLGAKRFAEAQAALAPVAQRRDSDDRKRAAVLAAHICREEAGPSAGWQAFAAVAADRAQAPEARYHAMRMAAGCAHSAGEYTTGVLAFRQIEELAPSAADRAEARVEFAGLLLELAGREKGTWPEVIRACDEAATTPDAPRKFVATAKLMRFESVYYSGDVAGALKQCEAFLTEFGDIRREAVAATVWRGTFLATLGRLDEAETVLGSVLPQTIARKDKFGGHEPQARAAYWLAYIAERKGNAAARTQYIRYIGEQFPGSEEAAKAPRLGTGR